ncbi:MAG: dUTP diphosphatase [Oscillospiraceae bacterium]|nr:dUTP diphosphatase [Oscillospiraceae bacterium]
MKLRVLLDEGARMPLRAHPFDAGMDLFSRTDTRIPARGSAVFDTGVHVEIPEGFVGFIKSKSGLNVKKNLQAEGVIDAGYTGPIVVKVYNHGDEDVYICAGDKLTQLVILPVALPELELAERLTETERGAGGFGSTGR